MIRLSVIKRGFTLIEILIVLALVVMIGGVSMASGARFITKIQWDFTGGALVHLFNRLTQLAQIEHTVVSLQLISSKEALRITSPTLKISKKFEGFSIDLPSLSLDLYPEETSEKRIRLAFKGQEHWLVFDDQKKRWAFKP